MPRTIARCLSPGSVRLHHGDDDEREGLDHLLIRAAAAPPVLPGLQTICILKGFHRRAVTLLRFSRNGKLLATIGHDMHHRQAGDDDTAAVVSKSARCC